VRLLAWNIQHRGGTRLARIVEEISAYDPDVVAVTEFCARPGEALCAAMKEMGLPHVETTHPAEKENGITVFSRTRMRRTRLCPAPAAGPVRWLDIDLPEYGLGIAVLHIMAAGSSKKHPTNVEKTASGRSCCRRRNPGCGSRFYSSGIGINYPIGGVGKELCPYGRKSEDGSGLRLVTAIGQPFMGFAQAPSRSVR
jgi:hypothetical protein